MLWAVRAMPFCSRSTVLRKYGPSLGSDTIELILETFARLGALVEKGILSYPYSLREMVNVVCRRSAPRASPNPGHNEGAPPPPPRPPGRRGGQRQRSPDSSVPTP